MGLNVLTEYITKSVKIDQWQYNFDENACICINGTTTYLLSEALLVKTGRSKCLYPFRLLSLLSPSGGKGLNNPWIPVPNLIAIRIPHSLVAFPGLLICFSLLLLKLDNTISITNFSRLFWQWNNLWKFFVSHQVHPSVRRYY